MTIDGAALILAGGASRRMGRDKARVPVDGTPNIVRLVDELRPAFDAVYVSAAPGDAFPDLDVTAIHDRVREAGPLVALGHALAQIPHEVCFVVACDTLSISLAWVARLVQASEGRDGAVAETPDGRAQPLFAVYRSPAASKIERLIAGGGRAMHVLMDAADLARVATPASCVRTFNTPEELDALVKDNAL